MTIRKLRKSLFKQFYIESVTTCMALMTTVNEAVLETPSLSMLAVWCQFKKICTVVFPANGISHILIMDVCKWMAVMVLKGDKKGWTPDENIQFGDAWWGRCFVEQQFCDTSNYKGAGRKQLDSSIVSRYSCLSKVILRKPKIWNQIENYWNRWWIILFGLRSQSNLSMGLFHTFDSVTCFIRSAGAILQNKHLGIANVVKNEFKNYGM